MMKFIWQLGFCGALCFSAVAWGEMPLVYSFDFEKEGLGGGINHPFVQPARSPLSRACDFQERGRKE